MSYEELLTVQRSVGKIFQIQGKSGAKLERKRKGKKQHDVCRNFQQFGLVRIVQYKTRGAVQGEQEEGKGKDVGVFPTGFTL